MPGSADPNRADPNRPDPTGTDPAGPDPAVPGPAEAAATGPGLAEAAATGADLAEAAATGADPAGAGRIEARSGGADPIPFADLRAPAAVPAEPPAPARWLAFTSNLVGGLLGGMIGYGTGDLLTGSTVWAGLGTLTGALIGAVGVGIVAGLALRAMNEWQAARHPEATTGLGRIGSPPAPTTDD
jgi:hypothetical protein